MKIVTQDISVNNFGFATTILVGISFYRHLVDAGIFLTSFYACHNIILLNVFLVIYHLNRATEYDFLNPIIMHYFSYFYVLTYILITCGNEILIWYFGGVIMIPIIVILGFLLVLGGICTLAFLPKTYYDPMDEIRLWISKLSVKTLFFTLCWMYTRQGFRHLLDTFLDEHAAHYDVGTFMPGFTCDLDDIPDNLWKDIDMIDSTMDGFILNPSLILQQSEKTFDHEQNQWNKKTMALINNKNRMINYMKPPYILVEDFSTKMISVYQVTSFKDIILDLINKKDVKLDSKIVKMLKYCNIIVGNDFESVARSKWQHNVMNYRDQWEKTGIVVFEKGVLHPLDLHFLRSYYENHILTCIKNQRAHCDGNYAFAWETSVQTHYNVQMLDLMDAITCEKLKLAPPLCLFYLKDSRLSLHVDYYPFLYSCSVLLEKDYDCEFCVIGKEGKLHKYVMDIGEAVMFKGQEFPHYRENVPNGKVTSLSFSFNNYH